jgi:Fe-Mn family superoxide dismutase
MLTITRRAARFAGAATVSAPMARRALAQTSSAAVDPPCWFVLPPLLYAPSANEPRIDALTMELHHDKHHAADFANLNTAL